MKSKNDKIIDELIKDLEVSFQECDEEYLNSLEPDELYDSSNSSFPAELSETALVEEGKLISKFLSISCPCGENCQNLFNVEELMDARQNFRLMSWREQHCFIIGKLQTFQRNSTLSVSARQNRLRERQKYDYFINADRPVCRAVFLFYHGETIDRLKRRQKYLTEIGTLPPEHGNAGRIPKHACQLKDVKMVKIFVELFVAIHGLPDAGRDLRVGKRRLKTYLPSVMNYRYVHRIYKKSMDLYNSSPVKYQTFRKIWIEHFSDILFSKPKSDLCMTCENNNKLINAAIASSDDNKKLEYLTLAKDHILAAKKERDYYRMSIEKSRESYHKHSTDVNLSSKENSIMHYSWDFAQQLHYPYEDHQVGPIYFKSPRIAQLFGVCCEALPKQVNYLIDEADFPGKGADTVISLLDHYFEHYGLNEQHALLTADNCVGQNKNNALLQYLMYRVMTGKHKSIKLSFMLVGHTKFSPDGYFGLIKMNYRRSKIYTYDHLVDTIKSSTPGGFNICQNQKDSSGKPNIVYRKWSSWLASFFENLTNITRYQHFFIEANNPGKIIVKESIDAKEETYSLLKKNNFKFDKKTGEPSCLISQGLSAKRQWYLYDSIRQHIPNEKDQNITAPKPQIPRPLKIK